MIARLALSLVLAASAFPTNALAATAAAAPAAPAWSKAPQQGRFWKSVKFQENEQEQVLYYFHSDFRSGRAPLYKITPKPDEDNSSVTVYEAAATPYALTIAESRLKVVKEGFTVNAVPGDTLNHDISKRRKASVPMMASVRLAGAPAPAATTPAAPDSALGASERKWLSFKEKTAYESERGAAGNDASKKKAADEKARALIKANIRADKKAGYEALLTGTLEPARIEAYLKDIPLYSGAEIELNAQEMARLRQEHASVVQQWEREALAAEDVIGRWQRAKEGRRLLATPPARPNGPQVTRPDGPPPAPDAPAGTANQPAPAATPGGALSEDELRQLPRDVQVAYHEQLREIQSKPPCQGNPPAPAGVDVADHAAPLKAQCDAAIAQHNQRYRGMIPHDPQVCEKAFQQNKLHELPPATLRKCCGDLPASPTGAPATANEGPGRSAMEQVTNVRDCETHHSPTECRRLHYENARRQVAVNLTGTVPNPQLDSTGGNTRQRQCTEAQQRLARTDQPDLNTNRDVPTPSGQKGPPGKDQCVKDAKGDCQPPAKDRNEWLPVMQGTLVGAPIGALIGAFFPPWGIVIGAAIGFSVMWGVGKYNNR